MTWIYWKKCKICGVKFDIGANLDVCPECRIRNKIKDKKIIKNEK